MKDMKFQSVRSGNEFKIPGHDIALNEFSNNSEVVECSQDLLHLLGDLKHQIEDKAGYKSSKEVIKQEENNLLHMKKLSKLIDQMGYCYP